MNFKDFPYYGLICDVDDKPIALGYEGFYCLLIEFNYTNALETVRNITIIARSQGVSVENHSDQIRIVKLFNVSEIQAFRRSYDWNSERESLGYTQLQFAQDKLLGDPDITGIKFNEWEDYISFT